MTNFGGGPNKERVEFRNRRIVWKRFRRNCIRFFRPKSAPRLHRRRASRRPKAETPKPRETFVAALRGRESVGTLVYFEFRARGEPPHLVAAYLGQRLENAGLPFSECGLGIEDVSNEGSRARMSFCEIWRPDHSTVGLEA